MNGVQSPDNHELEAPYDPNCCSLFTDPKGGPDIKLDANFQPVKKHVQPKRQSVSTEDPSTNTPLPIRGVT